MIGLCTGQLAAAAVSSCASFSELIPVAVEVVLVALRTGLLTMEVRDRVETSLDEPPVWSVMIPGLSAGDASTSLNEFCQEKVSIYAIPDDQC